MLITTISKLFLGMFADRSEGREGEQEMGGRESRQQLRIFNEYVQRKMLYCHSKEYTNRNKM